MGSLLSSTEILQIVVNLIRGLLSAPPRTCAYPVAVSGFQNIEDSTVENERRHRPDEAIVHPIIGERMPQFWDWKYSQRPHENQGRLITRMSMENSFLNYEDNAHRCHYRQHQVKCPQSCQSL